MNFLFCFKAPASMHQTIEREIACDWTIPLVINHKSILIKNPTGRYNITAYLEPMTFLSWLMVVIFLATVPGLLYIIAKEAREMDKFSPGDAFEATFFQLVMMGSQKNPSKYSTRVIFFW